jgi:hypothetical protein
MKVKEDNLKVNRLALAGMLRVYKRTNEQIDKQEIERANE